MEYSWRTRAKSNQEMVDQMQKYGLIEHPEVAEAMRQTDRGLYSKIKSEAYNDTPHPIGWGATISAPHMHARALDLLFPQVSASSSPKILDVGSGSGYLGACFARLSGKDGRVIGIDVIPELVDWSIQNMNKDDPELLKSGKVAIKVGDGWKGDPQNAPFDVIHVGAAAASLPNALVDQLKPGGRMIIPVGEEDQWLMQVDKHADGSVSKKKIFQVRYVPLVQS